jgi:uncharacterized protein
LQNCLPATFIVKLSGICNLSCKYCYYFETDRSPKALMDINLTKKLIKQSSEMYSDVHFIWHGGEPLLIGIDAFQEILGFQKEIQKQKQVVFSNSIQTNGTLINKKWVDLFISNKIGVGVSLDGPERINDAYRTNQNGDPSFNSVINGIHLLQEGKVDFSVLAVITDKSINYEQEIFNFFISNSIFNFDFLPCFEIDNATGSPYPFSLKSGDFSNFMNQIFDIWFKYDNPDIKIRFLEQIIIAILGGRPTLCKLSGLCDNYITLEHNGVVGPCDNLFDLKKSGFGNLFSKNLEEILNSSERISFRDKLNAQKGICIKCNDYQICKGGCSRYSLTHKTQLNVPNYFCADYREIIRHVRHQINLYHPMIRPI